jgi:hypothetical protein
MRPDARMPRSSLILDIEPSYVVSSFRDPSSLTIVDGAWLDAMRGVRVQVITYYDAVEFFLLSETLDTIATLRRIE